MKNVFAKVNENKDIVIHLWEAYKTKLLSALAIGLTLLGFYFFVPMEEAVKDKPVFDSKNVRGAEGPLVKGMREEDKAMQRVYDGSLHRRRASLKSPFEEAQKAMVVKSETAENVPGTLPVKPSKERPQEVLAVQGVLESNGQYTAIVRIGNNSRVVSVGECFGEYEFISIDGRGIVCRRGQEERRYYIP